MEWPPYGKYIEKITLPSSLRKPYFSYRKTAPFWDRFALGRTGPPEGHLTSPARIDKMMSTPLATPWPVGKSAYENQMRINRHPMTINENEMKINTAYNDNQ